MIRILLMFTLTLSSYSQEITSVNNSSIYGCFKQISNPNYEYTILLSRKDLYEISNPESNTILMMSKYSPKSGMGGFEMAPLQFEGTTFFRDSEDNWYPKIKEGTFFTAKGNKNAFSIQYKENTGKVKAVFTQFKKREIQLECTSDKSFIKNLHFKLLVD